MPEIWSSDFKNASENSGLLNSKISVAIEVGTNMVHFKADNGLGAWDMEPVPVAVIDVGAKKVRIRQDGDRLSISNGIDWNYQSFDNGRTWEEVS